MTNDSSTAQFKYDVCLSFAGEQRNYVEAVAEKLRDRDVRVFYDAFEVVDLWGKDLYTHLDDIYQRRAQYCVVFISADYARKAWTAHERKSMQARDIGETREYILPVRFDDSELPGFRSTIGYVDLRDKTPTELAELIVQKVQLTDGNNAATDNELKGIRFGVPRSQEEQERLVKEKPIAWEYRLYAGALFQEMAKIETKWRDHQLGFTRRTGNLIKDADAVPIYQRFLNDMASSGSLVDALFTEDRQEKAFGPPGIPGDPEEIQYLASRTVGIYESFLDAAAYLRSLRVSTRYEKAFELASRTADRPAQDVRDFIDYIVQEMDKIPEWAADPNKTPLHLEVKLTLSIDAAAMDAATEEFKRATKYRNK